MIEYDQLKKISNVYGDSFYIFDAVQLRENVESFKSSFTKCYSKIEVAYSYKTNYLPALLALINALGVSPEVVSEMEYDLAVSMGVKKEDIIYNGPVKNRGSLLKALKNRSRVNVDSLDELGLILEVMEELGGKKLEIGIRCNFGDESDYASRFGIDIKSQEFARAVEIIAKSNYLELSGLHCHLPDRDLDSVEWRTKELLQISLKTFLAPPKYLDFGGGFYGSDFADPREDSVSFDQYAKIMTGLVKEAYPDPETQPWIILEPGTALVANTMSYWTRVIAVKKIGSRSIAVVDGSIHELNPNGRQHRNPSFHVQSNSNPTKDVENWEVTGYTCIENDYLSKNYFSSVTINDFLGFSHVGSYNVVMKPPFIRPASAVLELNEGDQVVKVLRDVQTLSEIISGFRV
jgi:diaminopimelate decarboxylase